MGLCIFFASDINISAVGWGADIVLLRNDYKVRQK